jgi:hypothetical protein
MSLFSKKFAPTNKMRKGKYREKRGKEPMGFRKIAKQVFKTYSKY